MKKFLKIIFLLLLPVLSFAQYNESENCRIYKISPLETRSDVKHSIQDVISNSDTSFNFSTDETFKLDAFLNEHDRYKSASGSANNTLDIRFVICYEDNSGKQHKLGFDYNGNYQLDGMTYYYDERLAFCENQLNIGIVHHKQMLETKPYSRH
jgi:hypothetical protein